jgi:hypothetical protein
VSPGKRGGRFSYLASSTESAQTEPPVEEGRGQENEDNSSFTGEESPAKPDSSGGRGGGRGDTEKTPSVSGASSAKALTSVPKGKGRMKQERSQLNVRIPTTLKRQASAKAVLEGRDIGEVVEELLREYLRR